MEEMKRKISIFLPNLDGGGAEKAMAILANSFLERGYNVDLIMANARGPFLEILRKGVVCVDLQSPSVFRSLFKLAKYFRKSSPDVVLTALNYANVTAILARLISGKNFRLVINEQNNNFNRKKTINAGIKVLGLRVLVKVLYPFADVIVSVSKELSEEIKKDNFLNKPKVTVLYNPIIFSESKTYTEIKISEPYVISIGRLESQKNYSLLIRAFDLLQHKTQINLLILGEGSQRQFLEKLIQELRLDDKVFIPGFVLNPHEYLKKSKMLVLSSNYEGLPTVLIEALFMGIPVVSTNCKTGPNEILEGGKWGRLVEPGDVEGLCQAMLDTLNDQNPPDVKKRAQDFSLEKTVDAYLKVLFP
jgi:glycosyltransferase involved in cell wall biosynthesis